MSRSHGPETLVYAVPEAGKLLGLGRAGSYEAVKKGRLAGHQDGETSDGSKGGAA
jgi:hypothetical protein